MFETSEHRPGDVTLPNWIGRPLAVDVAVTSPFSCAGMRAADPADRYSEVNKHGRARKLFRDGLCSLRWCWSLQVVS